MESFKINLTILAFKNPFISEISGAKYSHIISICTEMRIGIPSIITERPNANFWVNGKRSESSSNILFLHFFISVCRAFLSISISISNSLIIFIVGIAFLDIFLQVISARPVMISQIVFKCRIF